MRKWKLVVALGLVVAACLGAGALFTEVQAAPRCLCPDIYAPVICDNGKIYPNQCVADCKHATGCVPYGIEF